ncbi:TPA: TniB family NTP-binding protein [Pseudomonas aeruginosa]|nr:TniB family NTP-binding protein [Pseudomonas aeruginosa]
MTKLDVSCLTVRPTPEMKIRLAAFREERWIGYDSAVRIREQIESLLDHPKTHRMPNLVLIGESNNGKSMILNSVRDRANPAYDINVTKVQLPVIMVQAPPSPDEGRLYTRILESLGLHVASREPEDSKLRRIKVMFQHLNVQMLILDDFFNIAAGSIARRRKFLNALRNLSMDLSIPIVISGTPETQNILTADSSIANRFKPVFVRRWNEERIEEYATFIVSIRPRLELAEGMDIMQRATLMRLLQFSGGLLGETVEILRLFASWAVRSGAERITGDMVTWENLHALGYVLPSDRTRHLER